MRFAKLMQVATTQPAEVLAQWHVHFKEGRANGDVDGLEFFASAILLTDLVPVVTKVSFLFDLFDIQRQQLLTPDSITLMLRACASGLHRTLQDYPMPPS